MRESPASYFCPDTLFPVPASISLASLSPPDVALRYPRPRVPPCPAAAGVPSPFFRFVIPPSPRSGLCLPVFLRHHQRLAHNLPQTLKRPGLLLENSTFDTRGTIFLNDKK